MYKCFARKKGLKRAMSPNAKQQRRHLSHLACPTSTAVNGSDGQGGKLQAVHQRQLMGFLSER